MVTAYALQMLFLPFSSAVWVLLLPSPAAVGVDVAVPLGGVSVRECPSWRPCSPDLVVLLWLLSFFSLRVVGDAVLSGGVGVVLVAVGGVVYVLRCACRWTCG
jgi:hypothetical protein